MRTKWILAVWAVLVLGLVMAPAAQAHHPLSIAGSVSITVAGGGEPTGLVGFAVIANPGFEKTITQHLPPFTLPVFIEGDLLDDTGGAAPTNRSGLRLLRKRLDTTLVLTNTTDGTLSLLVHLWNGDGGEPLVSDVPLTLGPHATKLLPVGDLLQ
jgi:hypothetical protein